MNKIIKKIQYSEKVFRFDVEAPLIATRQPYPHRELRHRNLRRWRRGRGSYAPYHQGAEGRRQPRAQRDCRQKQGPRHHGGRSARIQR